MNWDVYRTCKLQWVAMVASGDMTEEHYYLALEAILSYELGVAWTEGTAVSGISIEWSIVQSKKIRAAFKPVFNDIFKEWIDHEIDAGRLDPSARDGWEDNGKIVKLD